MSETRWKVHTLPGEPIANAGFDLTLSVATEAEEVVQAVEDAARRAGMAIERVAADRPPRYPATHDD